jgi:hypothetical protein
MSGVSFVVGWIYAYGTDAQRSPHCLTTKAWKKLESGVREVKGVQ